MKKIFALLGMPAVFCASLTQAQNTSWSYNFGTNTGTFSTSSGTSTNFLPDTSSGGGTDYVRVGSQGGSFIMTNVSGFGTGSSLVMTAPTATSVNKFSIFDFSTATTAFTLQFDMRLLGGTNGFWSLFAGNGASFSNASAFTGSEAFLGLRMGYGTGGVITTSNRAAGSWASLTTGISQSNNYSLSIFANNGTSDLNYTKNGTTYTATTNTWSLWLGNALVSSNLAKAQLANGTAIDSFMFYGENSTGNLATNIIDNFIYANYLISEASPVSSVLYWTADGATLGGSGTWNTSGANWSATNSPVSGSVWDGAKTAVFSNSPATVTVSAVATSNGIQFSTDGYILTNGTITLGGASAVSNSITADSAVTSTIASTLDGTGGMTKSGTGTLILSGSNTFSGNVTVSSGALQITNDSALGNTANDLVNNSTLKTTSSVSLGAGRDLSGSGTYDIANGTTLTVNGNVNNAGTTLANTGTLDLQGATRTLGSITINAPMTLNAVGAISATGLTAPGVNSGTATINPDIIFTTSGDKTLDVAAGGTVDLNGSLTNSASAASLIAKTGSGTLILSGANNMGGLRVGSTGAAPLDGGTVVLENSAIGTQARAIQHNFGTLRAASNLVFTNGLSIGGRTGAAALLAGSNMEFQGQSSFFRGTGTSGQLVLNVDNTTTFSGGFAVTSGGGTATGITFGGSGRVVISGDSTNLTEAITLADTVKLIANSSLGSTNVIVGSGNAIGGNGTIAGAMSLASGAKFMVFNLNAPLTVSGTVSLDNTFSITSLLGADGSAIDWATISNGTYTLINSTSSFTNIKDFGETNKVSIGGDRFAYFSEGSLQLNVVPEPSTYALLVLSAAGLGAHLLRHRRR